MPTKYETKVHIGVETKGLANAQQSTQKLNTEAVKGLQAQSRGFSEAEKHAKTLKGRLTELYKEQSRLLELMRKSGDKGGDSFKKFKEELKGTRNEAKQTREQLELIEKIYEKQFQDSKKRKGAFLQGLLQGGLPIPAAFLQRGPGMGQQLAGMAVGRTISRGVEGAKGLLNIPFKGMGGLQQMVGAIPGGGIIGGAIANAASFSGMALEWQRAQLEAAPYLGGAAEIEQLRAANKGRGRKKRIAAAAQKTRQQKAEDIATTVVESETTPPPVEMKVPYKSAMDIVTRGFFEKALTGIYNALSNASTGYTTGMGAVTTGKALTPAQRAREQIATTMVKEPITLPIEDIKKEIGKLTPEDRKELSRMVRTGSMGNIGQVIRQGMQLRGLNQQEAIQEAMGVVGAAGGRLGEVQRQGGIGAAFAARTMYGVGPEISGAFMKAGLRGGLVGGEGKGGESLRTALADGLKLGLTGTSLIDYTQKIASGIEEFTQTGIAINKDSLASLSNTFTQAGITATRAVTMAGGMQNYIQGIGGRGPQGGLDYMLLNMLGGYKGGGAEGYKEAIIKLEQMGTRVQGGSIKEIAGDKEIADFFRKIMEYAGGGAAGEIYLRKVMGRMGANISQEQVGWLATTLRGGTPTDIQKKAIETETGRKAAGTIEAGALTTNKEFLDIAGDYVKQWAGGIKTQASIQNQQTATGAKMLGVVQDLEKTTTNVEQGFAKLTSGPLKQFTTGFVTLSDEFDKAATKIEAAGGILEWIFNERGSKGNGPNTKANDKEPKPKA